MSRPDIHGRDHAPGGADPIPGLRIGCSPYVSFSTYVNDISVHIVTPGDFGLCSPSVTQPDIHPPRGDVWTCGADTPEAGTSLQEGWMQIEIHHAGSIDDPSTCDPFYDFYIIELPWMYPSGLLVPELQGGGTGQLSPAIGSGYTFQQDSSATPTLYPASLQWFQQSGLAGFQVIVGGTETQNPLGKGAWAARPTWPFTYANHDILYSGSFNYFLTGTD